jgi:hypothetical protein
MIVTNSHSRMARERRTVEAMIDIYCHGQHGTKNGLCEDCEVLRDYAGQRLLKCPFQEGKTTCAKCPVHCYQPEMRERIRTVMHYTGPRMLYRHPVMTVRHMLDGLRQEPSRPRKMTPQADAVRRSKT